ncbi:AzlC family protein [Olavius algarvensis associated proteobacterium Delta 3]|nr:AzlC family protein [Olavius algarvensis associated proteobacterium Delta 3]CAB5155848.1 AzlC family protein [Olavius algarvensis associated proteobacterium Delta 3]
MKRNTGDGTGLHQRLSWLRPGLHAAWPICLGYIPIGLAFGVLAQKAGLNVLQIGLMSILVFAGSSQFIAVSLLQSGAGALAIILTTFVVNLRHVLMSSAVSVFTGGSGKRILALFAYGVTDESFAVNMAKFREGSWGLRPALVVNHTANTVWILSTMAGGLGGQFIPAGAFGIDYALVAMFIILLVMQIRSRRHLWAAVLAGISATLWSLWVPGNSYVIVGSVFAASVVTAIPRNDRGVSGRSDQKPVN